MRGKSSVVAQDLESLTKTPNTGSTRNMCVLNLVKKKGVLSTGWDEPHHLLCDSWLMFLACRRISM